MQSPQNTTQNTALSVTKYLLLGTEWRVRVLPHEAWPCPHLSSFKRLNDQQLSCEPPEEVSDVRLRQALWYCGWGEETFFYEAGRGKKDLICIYKRANFKNATGNVYWEHMFERSSIFGFCPVEYYGPIILLRAQHFFSNQQGIGSIFPTNIWYPLNH